MFQNGKREKPHLGKKNSLEDRFPLFFYLVSVVLAASFFSPLFYAVGHRVWTSPFSRYYDRSLLLFALLFLLPHFLKRPQKLFKKVALNSFIKGAFLGLILGGLLVAAAFLLGNLAFTGFPPSLLIYLKIVVVALVVAFLEEIFFRAGIQVALVERLGKISGLTVASVFFALTHFFKTPLAINQEKITWLSGFKASLILFGFLTIQPIAFLNLFLFGIILGLFYLETKTLFWPIGIHFGVVLSLKLCEIISKPLFISYNIIDQISSLILNLGVVLICLFYLKSKKTA